MLTYRKMSQVKVEVEGRQSTNHLALNTKGIEDKSNSRETQIGKGDNNSVVGEQKR